MITLTVTALACENYPEHEITYYIPNTEIISVTQIGEKVEIFFGRYRVKNIKESYLAIICMISKCL